MTSRFDLEPRLEALRQMGLEVGSIYQGDPAHWLESALAERDAYAVNLKGVSTDDCPVLIRLSFLEKLLTTVRDVVETP